MKLRICLSLLFFVSTLVMNAQNYSAVEILEIQLVENKTFPNNPQLPVLLYKNVFGKEVTPNEIEECFYKNNWTGSWRNGIYDFQHYHSTAHEALGVYGGWAKVQLGGDNSDIVTIEKGDLVVLPAGIAHKRIESGDGFAVVGAYPDRQQWDMNYGKAEEVKLAKQNILKVRLPSNDPVMGENGRMFDYWK